MSFTALVIRREDEAAAPTVDVETLDDDALPAGEVTVEVTHSSLNYKDALVLAGTPGLVRTYPHVPGIDLAGRVSASEDPEVRRQAPVVLAAIDRAVKLCQDTLRFARAEEPDLRFSRFELAPLVDEVAEALSGGLPEGVVWSNGIDAAIVVRADRDQMFRVLLNLARNAAEAMAETGGQLRFSASRDGALTTIEVADAGPGVPARVQTNLFEAFSEGSRGTGLGLAIARELMRAHGGDLVLAETGPQGSRFRITLPDRGAA
jgi:signal transduction histidine kinase